MSLPLRCTRLELRQKRSASHQHPCQPSLFSYLFSKQLSILKKRARARILIFPTQGRSSTGSHPRGSQCRPWLQPELVMGSWLRGLGVSAQGGLGIPLGWSGICYSQIPVMPFLGISGSGQLQAAFPRLRVNQVVSPWRGLQGQKNSSRGRPLSPCLEQLWPSSCSRGHCGPSCYR